jgi:hypothetical protein
MQLYRYVGPKQIGDRVRSAPPGLRVESPEDVLRWFRQTSQHLDADARVIATFVVDEADGLRIADRRSEHVACAGGRPVQSDGEITFEIRGTEVRVIAVTNQSTGYCPEPESWPALAVALERAGLTGPTGFSVELVFRRCEKCSGINVVKDELFECAVCGAALPEAYNVQSGASA